MTTKGRLYVFPNVPGHRIHFSLHEPVSCSTCPLWPAWPPQDLWTGLMGSQQVTTRLDRAACRIKDKIVLGHFWCLPFAIQANSYVCSLFSFYTSAFYELCLPRMQIRISQNPTTPLRKFTWLFKYYLKGDQIKPVIFFVISSKV
jgi:hypothetical protein